MLKKIDVFHIFLILIIIFLLVLFGQVNSKKNYYMDLYKETSSTIDKQIKTIEKLEVITEDINLESIDHQIYELSSEFITAINKGSHDSFFSQELYDSLFTEESIEEHHGHSNVDTNIINISVLRKSNEEYLVYGIYTNEFGTIHDVSNENAPKMVDYYAITITWGKENNEFVVTDFRLNFLKDNLNDILTELENKE